MTSSDDSDIPNPDADGDPSAAENGREDIDSDAGPERSAQLPIEASLDQARIVGGAAADVITEFQSDSPEPPLRESLLAGMRQTRTTMFEVGEVARRLSVLPPGIADARRTVRQAVLSFAIGLTLVLLGTMAFAGGTWRLVLGVFAGTGVATLTAFGALRGVSKMAARDGARQLPGPALLWVGAVVLAAVAATVTFTWSVSEVTKPLAQHRSRPRSAPGPSASAVVSAAVPDRADAKLERGKHVRFGRGMLFVPPDFESSDGHFDVLIHYHGNVQLIEDSVAAAKLNALVLIINLGEGSGSYSEPLRNPRAFDTMLDGIEDRAAKLGLQTPRIRRVALSAWSAGYGAVYFILNSRSRLDRVDAVLLMDGMHGSFVPGSNTEVHPISLAPFVRFGRRAMAKEKLMVVTHSAIQTIGYPDSTRSASALLVTLGVARQAVDPVQASPPEVDLPVARRAFPTGEYRTLRVITEAHRGNLHVYGCSGGGKGDHIAHLAQMSVTVLPPLVERWKGSGRELGAEE